MSVVSFFALFNAIWTAARNVIGFFKGKKPDATAQAQKAQEAAQTQAQESIQHDEQVEERHRDETNAALSSAASSAGAPDELQQVSQAAADAIRRANSND